MNVKQRVIIAKPKVAPQEAIQIFQEDYSDVSG